MNQRIVQTTALATGLGLAGPAMAHTGHELGGLAAGLVHPLMGLDHLTVMLAIGSWAGLTCGRKAWIPMVCFPLFMALGAVIAVSGFAVTGIESTISASVLVMGLMLLGRIRLSLATSASLIALFALVHGQAHGVEMPLASSPWTYGIGFVATTAGLHVGGWAVARGLESHRGMTVLRGTGALISLFGAWLVWTS